ncbi:hypothetical protein D6C86_07221 [Aureobasidium pullulans]|uniref:Uncharacterized protein n=1 Tax=Aureobasidium pullulans TaxID=5580 RepID=A0A4S9PH34_AURPU|nr:hypothetical protein D6C94_09540 [Aureobasidium pullulans]THZ36910.1 hypothetical protein D6C87_08845 [Aureobasidium pullulans]THZ57327.1 hypothetical protein D6C86_07221 [Aureobasidium pullulans]THZ85219.1 hypothetical protein D6C88_05622 [Aureobasidium pullulans]
MSQPPKENMPGHDQQIQEPEALIQLAPSLLGAIHHIPGAFPCPELDLLLAQHADTQEHSSAPMNDTKEQHATHATQKPSEEIQKTLLEHLDQVKQQLSQALEENKWLRKQKAHDDAKRDGVDLVNEDEDDSDDDDSDEDDSDEDDDWDADEPPFGSIEMALYVAKENLRLRDKELEQKEKELANCHKLNKKLRTRYYDANDALHALEEEVYPQGRGILVSPKHSGGPREQKSETPVSCMSREDLEREHGALTLRLSVAKEEHSQTLAQLQEKENRLRHQNLNYARQINHLENDRHHNELRRELVAARKEHLETVAKLETQLSDKNVYISTCDKKIEGLQGKVTQLVRRDRTTELMCNQSISQTYSELQQALEKLERASSREAELKRNVDAKGAEVLRLTTQIEELASQAIDDQYTIQQYQAVISTTPSVHDQKSGVEDTVVEPLIDLGDDHSGRSSTGSQCGSDWTDVSVHHGSPDVGGN